MIDRWDTCSEIALRRMSLDLTDDKSTLVQVMAWYRQATSHYLNQWWPRSLSPYGVTRPQWVKTRKFPNPCWDQYSKLRPAPRSETYKFSGGLVTFWEFHFMIKLVLMPRTFWSCTDLSLNTGWDALNQFQVVVFLHITQSIWSLLAQREIEQALPIFY